ncbi:MAG TPA: hypothetical protein DD387_06170 [Lachnoclostridium sp.]|nr:hypothetical protein [Lachnoclostridium sp.]
MWLKRRGDIMKRDRATGIIAALLGVLVVVYAWMLPKSGIEGDIGPAVFPYMAAVMLIVCGVILAVRRQKEDSAPFLPEMIQKKRFLVITLVYVLYGILLWAVGFLIATPVACFVLCIMMSGSRKIAKWKLAVFSLIVTAVVYYCFYTLLSLKLPTGSIIRFVI